MNEREKIIRLWFDMWIKKADLGIDNIFTDDVVYTESWSPKYENRKTVKHWFDEWNTRGSVLVWEIKQFFHQGNQTIVEWYFKSKMNNGNVEEFDGISLIVWTQDNKIKSLKEFGCNLHNYNPYRDSDIPVFREEKANCFERTINSSLPYSFQQGLGQARPNKKLSQRGKNFQELKICGHGTILALTKTHTF